MIQLAQPINLTGLDTEKGHFIEVKGSPMHYLEQGLGDPILFLHGMPMSAFMWRQIIPALSAYGWCLAPDMIGMGKSAKPDIEYSVFDHIDYIEGFINALQLKDITLVMHGWGSVIGFEYARRHPGNVKGLAFFESHIKPTVTYDALSLPIQHVMQLFNRPGASYRAVVQQNYLVNQLLPNSVITRLDPDVFAEYQKPFPTPESRKPLWQYVQELPLGNRNNLQSQKVVELIANYSTWLQETMLPKLMLFAVPGFMTTMEQVVWAQKTLPNIQLAELENVLHFPQESSPAAFCQKLVEWFTQVIAFVPQPEFA